MNCDEIMESIAVFMLDRALGKTKEDPPEPILSHILFCPLCTKQMDVMLRILTGENFRLSKPLSCSEVCDRIPELVEVEEKLAPVLFPAEWLHLISCHDCRTTYEMTRACMTSENAKAFEMILPTVSSVLTDKPEIWETASSCVQRLSTELHILVSKGKGAFNLIPEWLRNVVFVPVHAGAYRDLGDSAIILQILTLEDQALKREIIVQTWVDEEKHFHLGFKLIDIENKNAVNGVSVALFDNRGRYLMQLITTDTPGSEHSVEFPHCPTGHYRVRITERKSSWEIPLHLE
jgi:hypothetical protein